MVALGVSPSKPQHYIGDIMSSTIFASVNQTQFRKYAKGFASAKDNLQLALGAAVYQAIIHSNPNWLDELFDMAGFWQSPIDGKHRVSTDGRLVYAYLTTSQDDGGCGLTREIIKLNRETKKWELTKGRKLAIEQIDMDYLWDLLETVRFDKWGKPKVESPKKYNPQLALSRVQKKVTAAITAHELDIESLADALATIESIRKQILNATKLREVA